MVEIIPVEYGKSMPPENMIFENGTEGKFRPFASQIPLGNTFSKF